ncbi:alpha/beta hydrolase [Acidaminobacter hydrogenoformans]|uniref:Carboxylesterase n=1 Tax=Acidaminobacter hydrogenoformans DSM 2784 TaxID=1120920 RepID=A0A1G5RVF1_9FIRM|nr:alpha/beta fold hydrolase [Acidaminobacter hydrogenoformans]SCZ77887.1 carboxylesterase [Acidaminobacter hydrogenoformans DSM 2784]
MNHSSQSNRSQPAFLLLHGFGGAPWEVEPLAEALRKRGYLVAAPTIKGLSSSSRRDMARYAYEEWIWAAEEAYKALKTQSDKIVLAGFSTGGLIAVHLAIRHNPEAIIFMSTPIQHWDLKRIMTNLGEDIKNRRPDHLRYYMKSTVKFPVRALWEFKRIQRHTKSRFGEVRCPALILQGLDDDTVHHQSAACILKGLHSIKSHSKAELEYFEPAGHVLLQGPARDQALRRILKFLGDSCIL